MLNRINPALYGAGRVLPLRSEQFSLQSPAALDLRGQIWFTPETIIWDGLYVVASLLLIWRLFCRLVDRFALRVLIIASLIFTIASFSDSPNLAVADVSKIGTGVTNETSARAITSTIVAAPSPIFSWPVPKTYISTYFSSYHKGIDIPNPYGTPVQPLAAGVVIFAGWDTHGFGNTVVVEHTAGFISRYSHLSGISSDVGQKVDNATIIGTVGATGVATGSHLHFEVHQKGVAINPLIILP